MSLPRTVLALCLVLLALQILSLSAIGPQLWGVHFYAYLPLPIAILSWLFLGALAIYCLGPGTTRALPEALKEAARRLHDGAAWSIPLGMLLAGTGFWLLRSRQTFLGDTWTIMTDLTTSDSVHPREPLTRAIQVAVHGWLAPGSSTTDSVQFTIAITSVIAGVLFVGLSALLARRITTDPVERVLLCLLFLSQGYAQLFFGYVEFYTLYALGVGIFLWTSLSALRGSLPLAVSGIVLVLTCGLHFSAVLLVPAWIFLAGARVRQGAGVATARDVVVTIAAVFGLDLLLRSLEDGASVRTSLQSLWAKSELESVGGSGLGYMFSLEHLRDFLNEQLLVGPFAALLLIIALLALLRSGRWRSAELGFLYFAGGVALVAQWFMSEPDLGYARDWDLFAPLAMAMTVAGAAGFVHAVEPVELRRSVLLVLCAFSLGHLLPWVWNNTSDQRALSRLTTLPLGYGRSAFLIGNWHWRHDRPEEAERWFQQAIEEHPANHSAHFNLGSLQLERGQLDAAVVSFQHALSIRPHQTEFLLGLTRALVAAGRSEEALPHLEKLRRKHPENFQYALYHGQVLRALGREQEAQQSFRDGAAILEPPLRGFQENLDAGLLLTQLGRSEGSIEYFEAAVTADPSSGTAAYYLSATLWQLDRRDEARPRIRAALELELPQAQKRQLLRWQSELEAED